MIVDEETKEFIRAHRAEDVRGVALRKSRLPSEKKTFALQQIEGRQIATKKIPSWAALDDILYPVRLSMEQCSSEQTARYKASVLHGVGVYADLTGGLGVDFSFMSRGFSTSCYVEQSESLCELAKHNFGILDLKNATVHQQTVEQFLERKQDLDEIYLDPARRNEKGGKVVRIADCSPNLLNLKKRLLELCPSVWVKYSPMLDIHAALDELKDVDEVHVVSVQNECKELLFHLTRDGHRAVVRIVCVNLKKNDEIESFSFAEDEEKSAAARLADRLGAYLYEPNASVMKAGAFKLVSRRFSLDKLDVNSHLYTSDELRTDFPGRIFRIESAFGMSKEDLKNHLQTCKKANVSVRNFPLSAEHLKAKLKIKDGGDVYLFATMINNKKMILKTFNV